MELRDWIIIIVVPGVAGLFVWYTTRYLPAKQLREKSQREFDQVSESESLGQVIKINETIINALVRIIDDRFTRIETDLDGLHGIREELQKITILVDTHNQEVIRNNEIQSDIDLLLQEIKMAIIHHNEVFHSEIETNEKS